MGVNTNRGRQVDRGLIKRVGRPTRWEVADLCPNLDENGHHDYKCAACTPLSDRNYIYTFQAVHNMIWMRDSRDEQYNLAGAWEDGKAIVVFPAHLPIADQDRLINTDDPIVDRLLITRGSTANTADLIRSPFVEEVLSVRDSALTYNEGTDFLLSTNATTNQSFLSWQAGGFQPSALGRYSVRLMIRPVWIVTGHPKTRAFGPGKKNQLMKTADVVRFDVAIGTRDES